MLNGGKKRGGRLEAINVCCARVCYSRDGAFVHFGKADSEFHLETRRTLQTPSLLDLAVSCAVGLVWARRCVSFCDHHPSYSLCACVSFSLILFLSRSPLCSTVSLGCPPPSPVCLSKHQISSLGETLEDSPSVYK